MCLREGRFGKQAHGDRPQRLLLLATQRALNHLGRNLP